MNGLNSVMSIRFLIIVFLVKNITYKHNQATYRMRKKNSFDALDTLAAIDPIQLLGAEKQE